MGSSPTIGNAERACPFMALVVELGINSEEISKLLSNFVFVKQNEKLNNCFFLLKIVTAVRCLIITSYIQKYICIC